MAALSGGQREMLIAFLIRNVKMRTGRRHQIRHSIGAFGSEVVRIAEGFATSVCLAQCRRPVND